MPACIFTNASPAAPCFGRNPGIAACSAPTAPSSVRRSNRLNPATLQVAAVPIDQTGHPPRNLSPALSENIDIAVRSSPRRTTAAFEPVSRREPLMKTFRKSMLSLGAAVAVGSLAAAYAPAFAAGANPCAPAAASPCGAKPANPCAAHKPMHHHHRHHAAMAHPCAAKANPCAAKSNPCAAKANPCAAKTNPCAPH